MLALPITEIRACKCHAEKACVDCGHCAAHESRGVVFEAGGRRGGVTPRRKARHRSVARVESRQVKSRQVESPTGPDWGDAEVSAGC